MWNVALCELNNDGKWLDGLRSRQERGVTVKVLHAALQGGVDEAQSEDGSEEPLQSHCVCVTVLQCVKEDVREVKNRFV